MDDTMHSVLDSFVYTFKQFTGGGGRGLDYEKLLDGSTANTDMELSLSTDLYRLDVTRKGGNVAGEKDFDVISVHDTSKNQIFPSYVMVAYTNDSEGKAHYNCHDVCEVAPVVSSSGVMWVNVRLVDNNRP